MTWEQLELNNISQKFIHFMVGIPGSGKSTYLKQLLKSYDPERSVVISADSIREELYGDVSNQGNPKDVFDLVYSRFKEALDNPKIEDIFIDNTNVDYKTRKNYYDIAKPYWHEVILYQFNDFELSYKRNRERERIVPEHVLDKMKAKFCAHNPEHESNAIIIKVT